MKFMRAVLLSSFSPSSNHRCYLTGIQKIRERPTTATPTATTRRWLNRFLFDLNELDQLDEDMIDSCDAPSDESLLSKPSLTVTLPADDYRTLHAAKILKLHNNDTIRAGIVSTEHTHGRLTDAATIEWIPQGKVKKAEPLAKSNNPPGMLRVHLSNLKEVSSATTSLSSSGTLASAQDVSANQVSLILALPRPLQINRILPMISQMGIQHLVLTGAHKVPRDYFGSHLFRKPQQLRDRLVEGLCQAGDVQLPTLHVCKKLHHLSDTRTSHSSDTETSLLDQLFPLEEYARVVAHPLRTVVDHSDNTTTERTPSPIRMNQVEFPADHNRKIVLAVGPEGGWLEPNELDWFVERGFQHVTLGPRVLRSDCAVISLLSLAHFVCSDPERAGR